MNAASRLKRSTSSSGSYSSPAIGHALVGAQPLCGAELFTFVQQAGRGLELLVLEQPAHQRLARILVDALVVLRRIRTRQQQA